MSLSIGIVGLPNVGKSTLFNALTRLSVPAANYPFCTVDPSVGIVSVPDARLTALAELSASKKVIPAVVEFVDIAGLISGASKGEGLGNQFLSHIRETDAILEVIRSFKSGEVTHIAGRVEPADDVGVIATELALADLAVVERRLGGLEREVKAGDKKTSELAALLNRVKAALEEGKPARALALSADEQTRIKELNLLTLKPILYMVNTSGGTAVPAELLHFFTEEEAEHVVVDAKVEEEIKDIEGGERQTFRTELGAPNSELDTLIAKSYALLDLITFFTTGEKETRAWTARRGSTAPEAGAAIHSDFRDRFIRASVIFWKELVTAGSYAAAREKGLVRTEGKEYIVEDGDVVEFKI